MPEYPRLRPHDAHEWLHRRVLLAYPRRFRDEYGDAMTEFFRDRLADARAAHGTAGMLSAWGATLTDTLRQAPPAWIEAGRRALARLVTPLPHTARAARRKDWMLASILQDVRHGVRAMWRAPAFTLLVLGTLALGTGMNAAIFSVVNGVLFRPLPYPEPERLLRVELYPTISEPEFAEFRDARSLQAAAAYAFGPRTISGRDAEPERIETARVSDGFFAVFGVPALVGRTFTPDEERAGAPDVVVMSHGLWQRRYGGDPGIVGNQVTVDGTSRTVVGVMPPSFRFPPTGASQGTEAAGAAGVAIWAPLRLRYDSLWGRNNHYLSVVARVAPGVAVSQADAELAAMVGRWKAQYPETYFPDKPLEVTVAPLADAMVRQARPFLLSLLGAVAFVLLIACVNVANLLLVRAESRRKELAIRTAMGASRTRMVRQWLTESLLYSLGGGVLGVGIAMVGVRALVALAPAGVPRLGEVRIDGAVLAFTAAVALLTGLAIGVVPALSTGAAASDALKEGGKASTTGGRASGRARRRLVMAEIALAVVTLSGAGLMLRSLAKLRSVDVGFDARGVATMIVSPPAPPQGTSGADASRRAVQLYDELLARLNGIPGVDVAAATQRLPIADGYSGWSILVDGSPASSVAESPVATPEIVTPDYFRAMRLGLVRGRVFTAADGAEAPLVAVVNEAMANALWPGLDPLGHTIRMYSDGWPQATVIGVVKDVRAGSFTEAAPPTMYFPHAQSGRSAYYTPLSMALVLRGEGDPAQLLAPARRVVREVVPAAPVSRATTLDRLLAESVGARRFSTLLLVVFAVLALLLAGIGIYGVISLAVSQRAWEFGVRMALGAGRREILGMVMKDGVQTALAGAIFGLAGTIGCTFLLRSLVFGIRPWDPLSLGLAVVALLVVVVAASALPAARATGVDPNGALRAE